MSATPAVDGAAARSPRPPKSAASIAAALQTKARHAASVKRDALKTNARLKRYLRSLQLLESRAAGAEGKEEKKPKREPKTPRTPSSTAAAVAGAPLDVGPHEQKIAGGDIVYNASVTLGEFGAPAAALTLSAEFKHVVDGAFLERCARYNPLVFLSFDVKMAPGRSTTADHKKYFEGLLLPIVGLPKLARKAKGIQIQVDAIGDLVRVSLMIPNPDTWRELSERLKKRDQRERIEILRAELASRGAEMPQADSEEIPTSDDDIINRDKHDPITILSNLGVDWGAIIKRFAVRVESAVNFETIADEGKWDLKWADLLQARARFDLAVDPALVKQVLTGIAGGALGEEMSASKMSEAALAYFSTFVKSTQLSIQLQDLTAVFAAIRAQKPIDDAQALRDIASHSKSDGLFFWMLGQPFWRALRVIADDECREDYRYRDASAILTLFKLGSTLLSKDVDEVSAVHLRFKNGMGGSVRFERALPARAICQLLSQITLRPRPDYDR